MGCGMSYLNWLAETDRLPRKGRVLDIGESCLLAATAEDIQKIWDRYGCNLSAVERDRLAKEYAYRSTLCGHPSIQTLFLGELLAPTTVEYVAIDVDPARDAHRFDLNVHSLAEAKRGTFDLIVNFGTTEHLMNQFNAFKVIHEAARVGGHIFHQVPGTGYINHGYFTYDAMMFQHLGAANQYELLDLWFSGPQGTHSVLSNAAKHPGVRDRSKLYNDVDGFERLPVPNSVINVLFQKTCDKPFAVGLELQTSSGGARGVAGLYDSPFIERAPPAPEVASVPRGYGRLVARVRGWMKRLFRKMASFARQSLRSTK